MVIEKAHKLLGPAATALSRIASGPSRDRTLAGTRAGAHETPFHRAMSGARSPLRSGLPPTAQACRGSAAATASNRPRAAVTTTVRQADAGAATVPAANGTSAATDAARLVHRIRAKRTCIPR